MKKTLMSLLLVVALVLALALPAMATDPVTGAIPVATVEEFDAAVEKALNNSAAYIQLTADIGAVKIDGVEANKLYLDLNGFNIESLENWNTLYLFDSATKDYIADDYGKVGKFVGGNMPVREFVTPKALYGNQHRYITIEDANGVLSSHRFYIGVSHTVLKPESKAVYYRTAYVMDSVLQGYVKDRGFTVYATGDAGENIADKTYSIGPTLNAFSADAEKRDSQNWYTIGMTNIMGSDSTKWIENSTKMSADVSAYLTIDDEYEIGATTIGSAKVGMSFQDAVVKAQSQVATLDATASEALHAMYAELSAVPNLLNTWSSSSDSVTLPYYCLCGASTTPGATHEEEYCNGEALLWVPYDLSTDVDFVQPTESKNYYLTGDITNANQPQFNSGNTANRIVVRIDMNGYNISARNRALQPAGNTELWLSNSKPTEGGVIEAAGAINGHGAVMHVMGTGNDIYMLDGVTLQKTGDRTIGNAAIVNLQAGNNFTMYGGTINATLTTMDTATNANLTGHGGAITASGSATSPSTFTMEGGTINGTATAIPGNGGNVYVNGATFIMNGGTIQNGKASNGGNVYVNSGLFQMNGGEVTLGCATNGGNVFINKNARMEMTGKSFVTDGKGFDGVVTNGGNIYIEKQDAVPELPNLSMSGEAEISGGSTDQGKVFRSGDGGNISMYANSYIKLEDDAHITGGKSSVNGGNINNNGGVIEMTGDSYITDGTRSGFWGGSKTGDSADIMLLGSGQLSMDGGKTGYVQIFAATGKLKVSGSANIKGVKTADSANITVAGAMTKDAFVYVTTATADTVVAQFADTFTDADDKAFAATRISGSDSSRGVVVNDTVTLNATITHCVCGAGVTDAQTLSADHAYGCNGAVHPWTAYTNSLAAGKYYLTQNISSGTVSISGEVYIDLNGYNITTTGQARTFNVSGNTTKLSLCNTRYDLENTGIISSQGASGSHSGVIMLTSDAKLDMFDNVTLQLADNQNNVNYGGAVAVLTSACEFNMYGGKIIGGDVSSTSNGGGAVFNAGTFNMYGGEIIGGHATYAAGAVMSSGTFKIDGSEAVKAGLPRPVITGGSAGTLGGNIYISGGRFTLTEGIIQNGTAGTDATTSQTRGGNLFSNGTAIMNSGSITGGKALGTNGGSHGGNVYVNNGSFQMDGGSITDGKGNGAYSSDVYSNKCGVTMNGGHIGDLHVSSATLTVAGDARVDLAFFNNDSKIDFGGKLTENASIAVRDNPSDRNIYAGDVGEGMTDAEWKAKIGNVMALKGYFVDRIFQLESTGIYVRSTTADNGKIFCPFGCTNNIHEGCPEAPLPEGTAITEADFPILESGTYYLTDNINSKRQLVIGASGSNTELDVILDLNGFNLSGGSRALQIWNDVELTLQNTDTFAVMRTATPAEDHGGVIASTITDTCNPYAIIQTVSNVSGASPTIDMYDGVTLRKNNDGATYDGGGVYLCTNANFNMHGGTVYGSKVQANDHSKGQCSACGNTTVKPSGNGGAFYLNNGCTLNVYGGTIVGAEVEGMGGAIYNAGNGTVNLMEGATVSAGTGNLGGAIYNSANGTVKLENATVSGGTAGTNGGAIYNEGTLTLNNVTLSGTAAKGGTIYSTKNIPLDGQVSITGDVYLDCAKLVLGEDLNIASAFNVKLPPVKEGAFTEGAAATINHSNMVTLNGQATVVRNGKLYMDYAMATNDQLLVGFGKHSISPTDEQIRFSQNKYTDSEGRYALALEGYGKYPAGTGRGEISSENGSTTTLNNQYEYAYNELMTYAVAYSDAEGDLILMISVDATEVKSMDSIKRAIYDATGVFPENIMISATHAHSSPAARNNKDFKDANGGEHKLSKTYFETLRDGIVNAAVAAIEDRKEVLNIETATADHVNGVTTTISRTGGYVFNSVRNYKILDSSGNDLGMMYTPNHNDYDYELTSYSSVILDPESTVDDSLQLIRYTRDGADNDLIIANFQTHPTVYGTGGNDSEGIVHADGVGPFRGYLSAQYDDADVVYFSGASGNINPRAEDKSVALQADPGAKFDDDDGLVRCLRWGKELAQVVKENAKFSKISEQNTDVSVAKQTVTYDKYVDEEIPGLNYTLEQRRAMAQAIKDAGVVQSFSNTIFNDYSITFEENKYTGRQLRQNWKIYSYYHAVDGLIARMNNKPGDTGEITLHAYAAGNIGFAAAPYEMFDENGQQIKSGSEFDMTVVATKTGNHGYIPSEIGYVNGGYAVDVTPYARRTAEDMANAFVDMLNGLK